jgi:hypothetical protein
MMPAALRKKILIWHLRLTVLEYLDFQRTAVTDL